MEEELARLKKHVGMLSVAMSVLGCLLFFGAAYGAIVWMRNSVREGGAPRCSLGDDGGVRISMWDGPFVITHIVAWPSRSVATLPQPIGSVESGTLELSLEQLKKLRWYGASPQMEVEFPKNTKTWRVLYLRPEYSREKESQH